MNDPRSQGRALFTGASLLLGIGLLALTVQVMSGTRPSGPVNATIVPMDALSGDATGYERVTAPRPLDFPDDHGPHPAFRTEWWYVTGNLASDSGRRFGFQVTFFRNALAPSSADRRSAWNTNQVYMAHFALTDVERGRHEAYERFARGAAGLAGARAVPFRVWLESWSLEGGEDLFPATLRVDEGDLSLDLRLETRKPAVSQGDRGYSQKGPEPGNASHYYSFTRLAVEGAVGLGDDMVQVSGSAWLDREWGTSSLSRGVAGWDWFALQLNNGHELMFYQLRGAAGPAARKVVAIAPDATVRDLADGFTLGVLDHWESPLDGAEYPSGWRLTVPALEASIQIAPFLEDQEMNLSVRYWEGAVEASGTWANQPITGVGYAELTGYGGRSPLR